MSWFTSVFSESKNLGIGWASKLDMIQGSYVNIY